MVGKVKDIEIIICQTEVEALVLETNLIKHLSPKYNILMKDDKNLTYIKITS
jgi:excinuclease ABC subunit C